MFTVNKYSKWYLSIIENAKLNVPIGYTEKHHIIPKSLGGSNGKDNLVILTARQHFICHLILPKMAKTPEDKKKMIYALHRMMYSKNESTIERYKPTGKIYEICRKIVSENQKITGSKSMLGKHHSEETKLKISIGNKNKIISKESREKNRQSHLGKKLSIEHKQKIGISTKNRPVNVYDSKAKASFSKGQQARFSTKEGLESHSKSMKLGQQHRRENMPNIQVRFNNEVFLFDNIQHFCEHYSVKYRNTQHLLTKYNGEQIPAGKFKNYVLTLISKL